MIFLILAGEAIVATSTVIETTPDAVVTPDGVFPFKAGITGTATVTSLPSDFRPDLYVWQGGGLVRLPDPPVLAPQITSMSFAQLLIGLVAEGWITEAEGDGWLVGTLPAPVLELIASLPEEQRFANKARASRFTVAYLDDPMVQALGAAQGKSAELPAFFNTYGVI
jgi:hypothetical protein